MRSATVTADDSSTRGLDPDHRVPALDGVRGLAILGVMIFHETHLDPSRRLDREFLSWALFLQLGVDLFFVLSGFLITGILLDSKGSAHYYRNFYARRILRIFPLYYAVLFLGLVVLPQVSHPRQAKWGSAGFLGSICYWSFQSNWWIALRGEGPKNGLIDLSWTLSIEEQFYLAWPFVVRACRPRQLALVCGSLIGTALLFRLVLVLGHAPPLWIHMMTPARWDALAVGAGVALVSRGRPGLEGWVGPARGLTLLAGATLASLILAWRITPSATVPLSVAGGTIVAFGCGGLLVLAATARVGSPTARLFESRSLRTFGIYSYALYLFHVPIQAFISEKVYRPSDFLRLGGSAIPGQLLFYVAATLPTLGCAWLSWHLFEGPVLRLKRYFPASPAPRGDHERGPRMVDDRALPGAQALTMEPTCHRPLS